MTTWLILIIFAIGIVWLIKKKPREEVTQQHEALSTEPPRVTQQAVSFNDNEEEELIAVITAAIAEFTGSSTDAFKVLRIRQHSANWSLTGRQDIMHNRL